MITMMVVAVVVDVRTAVFDEERKSDWIVGFMNREVKSRIMAW